MKKILFFAFLALSLQAETFQDFEKNLTSSIILEKDKVQNALKNSELEERKKDILVSLLASMRAKLFDAQLYNVKASSVTMDKVSKKDDSMTYSVEYQLSFLYDKYQALVKDFKEKLQAQNVKSIAIPAQDYLLSLKVDYDFNPNYSYVFIIDYDKVFSGTLYELPYKIEFSEDLDINTQAYQISLEITDGDKQLEIVKNNIIPLYSILDVAKANKDIFKGLIKEDKNTSFFSLDKYVAQKGNALIIFPYFYDGKTNNIIALRGKIQNELKGISQLQDNPKFNLSITKSETLTESLTGKAKSFFKF